MEIRHKFEELNDLIFKSKHILVVTHPKPDGDTLGSALAMLNLCLERGIETVGFCLDAVPRQYNYLPGTEHFTHDPKIFEQSFDLLMVFDASDLRFAGIADFVAKMKSKPVLVDFDHHYTNEQFGDVNIVDVTASSTAEVVYNFAKANHLDISQKTASCILTGILTDTGNFTNPGTTINCLEAAAELIRCGAKIHDVANHLVRNKPIHAMRLWGVILARLKYDHIHKIATTVIFADDLKNGLITNDNIEGISNFLNMFLDVEVIFVFKETDYGLIKGSLRTNTEADVAKIASALGGGGHKKAAGFAIKGKVQETQNRWIVVREK